MPLDKTLLALERQFWLGDADSYRKNLADECLLAFTEMAGVSSKEEIARTVEGGQRWRDLALQLKGLVEPAAGVAILTYEATATRAGGEPYAALVSSAYVQRDHGWKLAFHQQTPRQRNAPSPGPSSRPAA